MAMIRNNQEQYTILRIKRKRNEEPLDALVVESRSRRKKTKGGMNVFQFAETVEQSAWDDERLQSRISSLAKETSKKLPQPLPQPLASSSPALPQAGEPTASSDTRPTRRLPQIDNPSRKYTIVPSDSTASPVKSSSLRPTAPPKIQSYKELQKASFTIYEAVPSITSNAAQSTGPDPEMEKFLPMLQDYLRLSGEDTSPAPSTSTNIVNAEKDEDYVWDVFYARPVTFRELYGSNTNIGMVTGLPLDDGQGSDSDEEYEDEGDEDSNAEDWYTNDYPDEESPSEDEVEDGGSDGSDIFHEDSDYDDFVHDHSNGAWNYR